MTRGSWKGCGLFGVLKYRQDDGAHLWGSESSYKSHTCLQYGIYLLGWGGEAGREGLETQQLSFVF